MGQKVEVLAVVRVDDARHVEAAITVKKSSQLLRKLFKKWKG